MSRMTRNRGVMRRLAAVLFMVVSALTAAVSPAAAGAPSPAEVPAAKAAVQFSYIRSNVSGGAWLRAQPSTSAYGILYMGNGQEVLMHCWIDAQWVYPPNTNYASNRWFKISPTYSNAIGYTHSALVSNQRVVGRC